MIQRGTWDKIAPIIKCSPTVYTFTSAVFISTAGLLGVCMLHTPYLFLKVLFCMAIMGAITSLWGWALISIDDKK